MTKSEDRRDEDLIDLGRVVDLTEGPSGDRDDLMGGLRQHIGIADD